MPSPVKVAKFAEAGDVLRFAKLSEHAFVPIRGSDRAAGVDLKR